MLTDIRLGAGPDGWSVANRARELNPDMPLVYMSGDSAHQWTEHGVSGQPDAGQAVRTAEAGADGGGHAGPPWAAGGVACLPHGSAAPTLVFVGVPPLPSQGWEKKRDKGYHPL